MINDDSYCFEDCDEKVKKFQEKYLEMNFDVERIVSAERDHRFVITNGKINRVYKELKNEGW